MIADIIERVAAERPEAIAGIDDRGEALSYADLVARSDALLGEIGPARRLILIEGENSLAWLVAYVAGLRGGHPLLIVPGGNPAASAELERAFRPALRLTAASGYRPEPIAGAPDIALHPELAVMLSTSGSTGSAKCVRLSRGNIDANAASIGAYLGLGADERGVVSLPTHYSYGLSIVNSHLRAGATLLLTGRSVIEPGFWDFCAQHGATSFAGVPHSYEMLVRLDLAARAPASLRYFTQAGGRLPEALATRFAELAAERGWRFYIMYGQTEATARMAYLPPEDALRKPGCIGIAIPDGRFSLIDADGAVIEEPGRAGELIYEGPNVMMGYAASPADLAEGPGPARLPTGDIAERDAEGYYRITGRLSRFVKIFGNRIGLDDVERLLAEEGVSAVATGIDDQLLVVTCDAAATPAIARALRDRLKLPDAYFTVRAMADYPLLPSGKIDYAGLRASIAPHAASVPAGRDPAAVRAVFVAAFGEAGDDENASFASLGGDSLHYVSVALGLEEVLGDLPDDWPSLSLGALAALAAERSAGDRPARRRIMPRNLDTLRAIACVLVVIYHVVGRNSEWGLHLRPGALPLHLVDSLDFVRMPLFTAMAGFLYAAMPAPREGLGHFIARKARLLLAPLVFVTLVNWLARGSAYGGYDDLIRAFTQGYLHLWFIDALMLIFVVVAALDCWLGTSWRTWIAMLGLSVVVAEILPYIPLFSLSAATHILPFFISGLLLYRRPDLLRSRPLLALAAVAAVLALGWQQAVLLKLIASHGLMTASFVGGCSLVLLALRFFPRLDWLEVLGPYSFTIYLWHPMANALVRAAMRTVTTNPWLLFVAGLAGGILLPMLLQRLAVRAPRWISLPMIGK